MTPRPLLVALAVVVVLTGPAAAVAETFKLQAPDGTVYYTNAPTDPAYQRMGFAVRAPEVAAERPRTAGDGFTRHIREASGRYGVPEKLVNAVIRTESGFNPRAVSPKGARGLMQLMPQTATLLGVRDSFDPAENIDGGVRHLRSLIDRFGNSLPLALAAYNAGEQAVTLYRGIPPYPETQDYVQKVLGLFNGNAGGGSRAAAHPVEYPTYRFVADDGTVVYSNLPPTSAARLLRR